MSSLIVDTCLAIWLTENAPVSPSASRALGTAAADGRPIYVSPITAWEVGILAARRRIALTLSPERWFETVLAAPGVRLAQMPPRVLIAASFLPGRPPKDPADRIIAATARDLGATLMTRDRLLLDYATQGHVKAIAC